MQKIQQAIKVMLLLVVVMLVGEQGVYAEQLNSVKDCIEQPDKCSEETKVPQQSESDKSVSESSNKVGLTLWDFVKMIFATIFVVALLYFMLKFINKKSKTYNYSKLIQNIGGTSLGGNRSVQIIKVGERILILGVGENIQLLKEIENGDEVQQVISEYNNKIEQQLGPSDIVTKVLKRTKSIQSEDKVKGNSTFSSILKKQLEDMSKGRKKLYEEMEKKGSDE